MQLKSPPTRFEYTPLRWTRDSKLINPETLTDGQKQTLWRGIKTAEPALADLLTKDPDFAALKKAFNGTVVFEPDDFNRFIQAGQKNQ